MNTYGFRVAICVVSVLCSVALGLRDFSDVEIKAKHVGGVVYMLEGYGGNIGVSAGADGILMVDDQFAPLADRIRAAIKKLGGKPGELKFVLNTHWHTDHTGGNEEFGPEAPIIAHENVRKRLTMEQNLLGRVVKPYPKEALPVVTFKDSVSVHFNDEHIRVIHYANSHTDGDCVVWFTGSNVLHMGDLYFSGMFPFVDLDSGGDVEVLTSSVDDIIKKAPADIKIIPGHGPLSTVEGLKV